MNDDQLQFDRTCHVIYSRPCKAEIREKIAHHYPESQREAVWERVQMQYVDFLSDWRTDLGGEKNFHNGPGGNCDCIALMAYYVVCKDVTSLQEIEEMEGNLFLPSFRKLSKLKFIDINKPLCKKLLHPVRFRCRICRRNTLRTNNRFDRADQSGFDPRRL